MKNIHIIIALLVAFLLTGCGSGGPTSGSDRSAPIMISGQVPSTLAEGESRPGGSYRIAILGGHGEAVVFQVIEPRTVVGGQDYPLVLEGHGFAGSRQTNAVDNASITALSNNGYGVISIDQRGHGESGGTIR